MQMLKRLALILSVFVITAMIFDFNWGERNLTNEEERLFYGTDNVLIPYSLQIDSNWRQVPHEIKQHLSKLGKILFFEETPPTNPNLDKQYTILVWKYGPTIEKRHIYHYTNTKHDPFRECSVKNCKLTYNEKDLDISDLVIIHLHRTKDVQDLPPLTKRPRWQRWAFLTDESPYHTFLSSHTKLKDYNGVFNWSMTYRMNADIPVPYGRTTLRKDSNKIDLASHFMEWRRKKRSDVLISVMGSNCGSKNHRWQYVKALQNYIDVDTYGGCGTLKCPGHFGTDCHKLDNYMFYLSFENSNCDEYITEKLWWNAYHKKSIPIVMGANKRSYSTLLPPGSYINTENFASPQALADYIKYLNHTTEDLFKYFSWLKDFEIHNEHGYFQSNSFHYCRACEALNYNDKSEKVYNNLEEYWSVENDCHSSWDDKELD
ncbi:glycoprotein 3-alpha-L-fucosyltransferase A-like [Onthophagus taurus]|uniref:glycoprotein 3-alpha-L-fucosyltransferase A-like n=1 Tax=Onthophagus taurus TaxID=166361 RepID=UPI0039BE268E